MEFWIGVRGRDGFTYYQIIYCIIQRLPITQFEVNTCGLGKVNIYFATMFYVNVF